jgi:hypothetical protein
LAVVSARDGIQQALAVYALALDEGRLDLLADHLTEDVVLHFPAADRTVNGREQVLAFYASRVEARGGDQARHVITNLYVIEQDASSARTVAYFTVVATALDDSVRTSSGWYRDRLVQRDGRWRFAERIIYSDHGGRSVFPALG